MSVVKIRAALEVALNAMIPALATSWENKKYTPITGTPYQQVYVTFAEPDNTEYRSGHRELGVMQVKLLYPLDDGTVNAATRANLIRSTFYRGASFTDGGVTTIIERTPEIGVGQREGDRWALPVRIRFFSNLN